MNIKIKGESLFLTSAGSIFSPNIRQSVTQDPFSLAAHLEDKTSREEEEESRLDHLNATGHI